MLQLLGVIVLLVAVAPIAMAGGTMIAAFMTRQRMAYWTLMTLALIGVLVASSVFAVRVVLPQTMGMLFDYFAPLASACVMLTPTWALWFWANRQPAAKVPS